MNIAFLGLGIMGRPMAAKLVEAGHAVTVWNRTAARAGLPGARTAATPAQAAEGADVVWACVNDTAASERVFLAEDGVLAAARPGMVIADSSTISPEASRRIAERLASRGAVFLDCPVTGSKQGAEAGKLIFIVGGPAEAAARLQPLFQTMGQRVFLMGGNGMGLSAKLAMNLNIALIYEGFCEGLVLAEKSGLSAEQMLEIIGATMLRSGVVEYKAPFIRARDYSPNFPLRLMWKDIRLMLEHARSLNLELPALTTVETIYARAMRQGLGDQDYAATLGLMERQARLAEA